jgi:hypothetical protein
MFIMYVSDIPRAGRALLAQYADDTAAFYHSKNLDQLTHQLQIILDALLEYFRRWRIKINASKTEAVLFSKRDVRHAADHQLRAGTTPLPWQAQARFLGVILDRRMTFAAHVKSLQRKATAAMSIIYPLIRRSSNLLPDIKMRLAMAYVRPIMTYAAPAWTGMTSDTNLRKLQVLQNKYVRTALNLPYHTNMVQAHRTAKIPLIGDAVMKLTTKFFDKAAEHPNPLIAALHDSHPDTQPFIYKHKMPKHRIHENNA